MDAFPHLDKMRDVITESFDGEPVMIGAYIVVAESTDADGENSLLTWYDGGSPWLRLGIMEWVAEKSRLQLEEPPD